MKENKDIKNLLAQLSKSNEFAFRTLFDLYSNRVYTFALRMTRSHNAAEEMVQDVFLKIWINRESLHNIDNFSAYLLVITKNLTLNLLKRRAVEERAKTALIKELEKRNEVTEETVIYRDYQQLLQKTINHLPPQQRLVYSLCHQEGLQYEEVAAKLNISRLTVKSHMQQALKTIKAQFAVLVKIALVFLAIGL